DLARIEVLRGPQGTLYGSSSIGGLLKFVTVDPSTDELTGRLQAGASAVFNGNKPGYNVRGSVNVPLSDTWAFRASAFTRLDPGYIDDPGRGIEGVNEERTVGGRLAALWKPSDSVALKLSALYQRLQGDGLSSVDPRPSSLGPPVGVNWGDLQQSYLRGTGQHMRKVQAYSATLTAKLGAAELTSLTGYSINELHEVDDLSYLFGAYTEFGTVPFGFGSFTGFGVPGTPFDNTNKTRKLSQEVRLSMPLGDKIDWLLGAFYTRENSDYQTNLLAADPASGRVVGAWFFSFFPSTYKEYAGFTDLTYKVTDRFDIQLGVRHSHIEETAQELDVGAHWNVDLNFRPDPFFVHPPDMSADALTYLVTPRFKITPDLMVYARTASGYRAGGINLTTDVTVPRSFAPD